LLRRLIYQAHGPGARIRLISELSAAGALVFVVDFEQQRRHYRVLGSLRTSASDADTRLVELSAMDLVFPDRLVSHHEQLMSLVFALSERVQSALLLGLGGAAMWRFVRKRQPSCAMTLVEIDENIAAIARRWFYLNQSVVIEAAERFMANAAGPFDAIIVDVADAGGFPDVDANFWKRCLDALAPGGCIATNWPDFDPGKVRSMARAQTDAASDRGYGCIFIGREGVRNNIIQYLATAANRTPATVAGAVARFASEWRVSSSILADCIVSTTMPEIE
jgi:predicted O-methyltransferase YrrM